jgi:proline iminopeptidase
VGHDTGGFVAQELALRHPERVAGLVLVATSPGEPGVDEPIDEAWGPPPPVEVEVLTRVPPASDAEWEATMKAIAPLCFHRAGAGAPEALYSQTTFSAEAAVQMMQVVNGWSSADRLADVRAPALVVAGRYDALRPPQQSERLARRMPGAELVVLEESGHFPWLEEPEAFFTAVGGWCRRIGGSRMRAAPER